jgi:muramoyltetrapeptide carboxypeptidase
VNDEQNFTVLGVEHVHITTPEELATEVVDWYRSCLDLEVLQKPTGTQQQGAWFQIGTQELHISIDEHNPPRVSHFCLVVDSLDPVIEKLRAGGSHIEQASKIPGRRRFYTRDPAGNRIEIMHYDDPILSLEEALSDDRARVMAEED